MDFPVRFPSLNILDKNFYSTLTEVEVIDKKPELDSKLLATT